MLMHLKKIILVGVVAALPLSLIPKDASSQNLPVLRISTENNARHVQTHVVDLFAKRLQKALKGRLLVEHHHSAALFRDRQVVKAIADGKVEMAVPGTWQLDRFEPSVGIFLLPMFYGREATINYHLRDGAIGQKINGRIGQSLGVQVLGRWIDLGYAHLYSVNRPINRHTDLQGMRIRIAGGEANALRLQSLGAVPTVIPWPDLQQALANKRIDGLLTTHATVVSAKLWTKGVRYAFEDRQYFAQYVPIISARFWKRLPEDMRKTIADTWESIVDEGRAMARKAQDESYRTLKENDVAIVMPGREALAEKRREMTPRQAALAKKMKIDPALLRQVHAVLGN